MRLDPNYMAILIDAYMHLVATAERVNAIQRLVDSGTYVSPTDIYSVLGIKVPAKTESKVAENG